MIATVIIIIVLIAVIAYSVRSYISKLFVGCCGGGDSERKVKVTDRNKANYSYSVKIGIDGMTCGHCKARVENALNEIEGVWAKVDLGKKCAEVLMKKEISDEELGRIVSKSGYTVTGIEH